MKLLYRRAFSSAAIPFSKKKPFLNEPREEFSFGVTSFNITACGFSYKAGRLLTFVFNALPPCPPLLVPPDSFRVFSRRSLCG